MVDEFEFEEFVFEEFAFDGSSFDKSMFDKLMFAEPFLFDRRVFRGERRGDSVGFFGAICKLILSNLDTTQFQKTLIGCPKADKNTTKLRDVCERQGKEGFAFYWKTKQIKGGHVHLTYCVRID